MMGQESYTRIASLYPDTIENEKNIYIDPILRIQKSKERLQAAYAQNPQSREVVVQLYRIAKIQNDHNAQTRYRSEIEVLDPFYISSGQLDSK
jgi:hypothetical protein